MGPPPPGYGAAEYEFTAVENETIGDLASKMRFVGLMGAILGVLLLLAGIAGIVFGGRAGGSSAGTVVQGFLSLLVGIWTRSAAAGFQRIVDTQGHDIANLMSALGELRRIYTLQRVLYVVVIILFVLTVQLALLLMTRGTP
jgi:hypothetical protein